MKRSVRVCIIMQQLMSHPNTDFPLNYFAEKFDCAKSSISEDLKVIKEAIEYKEAGTIVTNIGAKGGVKYIPEISKAEILSFLEYAQSRFAENDRALGSGFLYTSDVLFDPKFAEGAGRVFAKRFGHLEADLIITVETKGIAVAEYTAQLLGLPLVVVRRESKVSDGSTVSINYFSGSSDRIQKMSLSKRAIKPGSKAIIIDDFIRGGGSISGLCDMLAEFGSEALAAGVVLSVDNAKPKKKMEYFPLLIVNSTKLSEGICDITINNDTFLL